MTNDDRGAPRVVGARIRVLDGHDRVRTPGQHAARRDGGRGTRADLLPGRHARRDRLLVAGENDGLLLGGTVGIGGAHGEAVHVRAIEARDVDLRAHVLGEHPAERLLERDLFGGEGPDVDDGAPATLRLVAIEHLEELALPHGASSS